MEELKIESLCRHIHSLDYGKEVGGFIYVHVGSLQDDIADELSAEVRKIHRIKISDLVVKVSSKDNQILSLLHYPNFLTNPHPSLCCSTAVSNEGNTYREWKSSNRPILHRKELFIPLDHSKRRQFAELTHIEETLGLYEHPTKIGWSESWKKVLLEKGIVIEGYKIREVEDDDRTP